MDDYQLLTADESPWDALPLPADGGPAMVVRAGGWSMSTSHTHGEKHVTLRAHRVLSLLPYTTEDHPLNGTTYPTQADADRAAYEAGILVRMVYHWDRAQYGLPPMPYPLPVGAAMPSALDAQANASRAWRAYTDALAAANGAMTGPAGAAVFRAALRFDAAHRLACRCVHDDLDTTTHHAAA